MSGPERGITVQAHVVDLLRTVSSTVLRVFDMIVLRPRRPTARERDEMQRALAGCIGNLEAVRLWLIRGAPR